ncbi:MAG: hypothetical protein WC107_00355 [Patescibacteria group bacterium]
MDPLNCYRYLRKKINTFLYKKKAIILFSKLRNCSFRNVNDLSKDIPFSYFQAFTPEQVPQNDFYGIATNLKKYAGIEPSRRLEAIIEHGVYFYLDASPNDLSSPFKTLITFGSYRENRLKKATDRKIFKIGPYIRYVEPFLSKKEFLREKKHLGKNLLAFPVHSDAAHQADWEIEEYCDKLKKIQKEYGADSITVCLYWRDVVMGRLKHFQKKGFNCVSAGHLYDPMFLSRLRSIIELSDFTTSNQIGTHLGYCIALGKPHYLNNEKVAFVNKHKEEYKLEENNKAAVELNQFFGKPLKEITKEQEEAINRYWGLGDHKTREELGEILRKVV